MFFTVLFSIDPFSGDTQKKSLSESWMILSRYNRLLDMLLYGFEESVKNVYSTPTGRNETTKWKEVVFDEKKSSLAATFDRLLGETWENETGTIDLLWRRTQGL